MYWMNSGLNPFSLVLL